MRGARRTIPVVLRGLGELIADAVREHAPGAARLAGPELGAVALAAAGSLASGLPFLLVRKEAKGYGTAQRVEGEFEPGEEVCVVEDVVTSGGALLSSVEALREVGLVCRTAVCVDELARNAVRLRPLFTAATILAATGGAANPHG